MNQTTDTIEQIERSVLASCLVDESAIWKVHSIINADSFSVEPNAVIFQSLCELIKTGTAIDTLSVCDWLEKNNKLIKAGGAEYIHSLTDTTDKIEAHAKLIADAAGNRRLTRLAIEMAGKLRDGSFEDNYSQMQSRLLKIAPDSTQFKSSGELALDVLIDVRTRFNDPLDYAGLRTGYKDFDRKFSGLVAGLHLIQGRTSSGKTWLALGMAEGVAEFKVPAAFISFEMSAKQIMYRRLSRHSKVSYESLVTGRVWYKDEMGYWQRRNLSDGEQERIEAAYEKVQSVNVFTYSGHGSTSSDVIAWINRMRAQYGVRMVVVDYIQKMTDRAESQALAWGNAANELQQTASSLELPIILLSQVNREVKNNADRFLDIGASSGSGQVDSAADAIYSITSSDYEKRNDPTYKRTYISELMCNKDRLLGHAGRMIQMESEPVTGAIETISDGKKTTKD
jgi:replicative DNA helicase